MEKKFIVGSFSFFSNMPGYKIHDLDYCIVTDEIFNDHHHIHIVEDGVGKDYFYWKKNTPEWHINRLLEKDAFALDIAKILVPEVAKELGININHLKLLHLVIDKISKQVGPKYNYYKIIYESYIENNSFTLTEEQILKAYNSYKESREEDYAQDAIIFVGCTYMKLDHRAPAKDIYTSLLFKNRLKFAYNISCDKKQIFILSGKYGILDLDEEIDPYDIYISQLNKEEKTKYNNKILKQTSDLNLDKNSKVYFLAEKEYYEGLTSYFHNYIDEEELMRKGSFNPL